MEQKRCPKCGFMNHPDMEMCAKCGQKMKGLLSNLNISTTSMQDEDFEAGMGNMNSETKERLLNLLEDKAFAKNLTPDLKNKIEKAVAEGRFSVKTTTKTYNNNDAVGLELAKQLKASVNAQTNEGQEIKSSKRAIVVFLAAIGMFIAIIGAVAAILLTQTSTP